MINMHIAFLSGLGVRWPPGKLTNELIDEVRKVLDDVVFPDFNYIGMYFHIQTPGYQQFGLKDGEIKSRLNKKEHSIDVKWACGNPNYNNETSWESKLNYVVDGVREVLKYLFEKYKKDDFDIFYYYDAELEALKKHSDMQNQALD